MSPPDTDLQIPHLRQLTQRTQSPRRTRHIPPPRPKSDPKLPERLVHMVHMVPGTWSLGNSVTRIFVQP